MRADDGEPQTGTLIGGNNEDSEGRNAFPACRRGPLGDMSDVRHTQLPEENKAARLPIID